MIGSAESTAILASESMATQVHYIVRMPTPPQYANGRQMDLRLKVFETLSKTKSRLYLKVRFRSLNYFYKIGLDLVVR